jgi:hypothetical protein
MYNNFNLLNQLTNQNKKNNVSLYSKINMQRFKKFSKIKTSILNILGIYAGMRYN